MKNKIIFLPRIIMTLVVSSFLIYIFVINDELFTRITLVPFIICTITTIIKYIFLMLDNQKYVRVFSKIYVGSFFIYIFGFLGFWCYTAFKNDNFILLFFSLPFWLFSIYIFKKILFKENKIKSNKNIKSSFNFKTVVSGMLIIISFIVGIIMLTFGINDMIKLNGYTKNYIQTDGYFIDCNKYLSDSNKDSYTLKYLYIADGKEYTISTTSGTQFIPKEGSTRLIKYNPQNPIEAIIVGNNAFDIMIFMGILFVFVPLIMILGIFKMFNKVKFDVIGLVIGLAFIVIGFGVIYMLTGSISIINIFRSYSIIYLIPFFVILLFIIFGIFIVFKSLKVFKRK